MFMILGTVIPKRMWRQLYSQNIGYSHVSQIHLRTGHDGPNGKQRYTPTLSLTPALDGGGRSTPRSGRFSPRTDPVPIVYVAGWAPGPVWTGAENLASTGIRSPCRPARSESLYRLSYPGPFL